MLAGRKGANRSYMFVKEYFDRRALSKIGVMSSTGDLTLYQVAAFTVIANEVEKYRSGK